MSKKVTNYTQCKIENDLHQVEVCWLPSIIVKQFKRITIDNKEGVWTIMERYATKDAEYVEGHERDYKTAFPSLD